MDLFTAAECDAVVDAVDELVWKPGRVATPAGADTAYSIRSCSIAELVDRAVIDRLQAWLLDLNRELYAFDATGFLDIDPITAMRYGVGDHFGWHIDNATAHTASRKLSFSLQLSDPADYDGGDLELALYTPTLGGVGDCRVYRDQIRRRGAITVFPAFHLHRISPIERGTRTALVGWIHGSRFR